MDSKRERDRRTHSVTTTHTYAFHMQLGDLTRVATIKGGGSTGLSSALRHGIALEIVCVDHAHAHTHTHTRSLSHFLPWSVELMYHYVVRHFYRDISFSLSCFLSMSHSPYTVGQFDVMATIKGGGSTGQSSALRHGIALALQRFDSGLRPPLRADRMFGKVKQCM